MSNSDNIYATPLAQVKEFVFDENVVEVFPDMIKRSVPGYQTIISTIGQLASLHVKDNSTIYDLGCSLGEASVAVRRSVKAKNCKIMAIDNSPAMVERCQIHLQAYKSDLETQIICEDILDTQIQNASMVILNFTLQFLSPEQRTNLLKKIYQGLNPGGILVLSEKLNFADTVSHKVIDDLHLDFKRANGYSELEISQKRSALENVMRTDTLNCHYQRLQEAGFEHYQQWYQCFNFCSMLAIK